MKLLFCKQCQDIFKMTSQPRRCSCGAVYGYYIDDDAVKVVGDKAVVLGIANSTLGNAIRTQCKRKSRPIEAWVFAKNYFRILDTPEKESEYPKRKAKHEKEIQDAATTMLLKLFGGNDE